MPHRETHGGSNAEVAALRQRVAELESAAAQRAIAVRYLDAMDRVNRVMRGTRDVDQLLTDLLDELLELFSCDRAWLLYPCDPDAPSWSVPKERTRAEWPGSFALGVEIPMDPEAAAVFTEALEGDEPLAFDSRSGRSVPSETASAFHVQSQMVMAVHPKTDKPWLLGIHHCARAHEFTDEEQVAFRGVCHRIGDSLGTLLVLRDLVDSERRYRTLVEHAPEAIVVWDPEGRCVEANARAVALFGVDRDRLLGMSVADLSPQPQEDERASADVFMEHIEHTLAGQEPQFEWSRVDADGSRTTCEVHMVLHGIGAKPLVRASIVDITGRLALQQQLQHLQKMEAIGELAGGLAHDFNNQLLVILGYTDMLRELPGIPPRAVMLAERVGRAAEQSATLTQQLLAFSRRAVLEPRVVDLNRAVTECATVLRKIVGSPIELKLDLFAMPTPARVDPHQLEHVLINLVANARDALPRGGHIRVSTAIREFGPADPALPTALEPGVYATFAVTDDGVGMDAATRARAFEPFYTTKDRGKGTGLGLSSAYGVVRQSGGVITLESALGKGTTVTVLLPMTDDALEERPPKQLPPALGGTESVLLVDDHEAVAEVAEQILAEHGYHVISRGSAASALECVARGDHIDLLLTDVMMPEMDGVTLAERARELQPGLLVMFTTGYSVGAIERLIQAGAQLPLLQKPYTARRLLELVRSVLDGAR